MLTVGAARTAVRRARAVQARLRGKVSSHNMCMPAIAFGGELQMWARLSGKTTSDKIEEHLETLYSPRPGTFAPIH